MSWKPPGSAQLNNNWLIRSVAVFVIVIALVALGLPTIYWRLSLRPSFTGLLIAGLGAFGTLVLAAATLVSVSQTTRSLSEMEKDREKPVVKDEIVKVIQPAIDALEANAERAESGGGVDWIYSRPSTYNPHSETKMVSSVFGDPAPAAMSRFQQQRPDLWSRLEDHQNLIKQIIGLAETIYEKTEEPAQSRFEEGEWVIPEEEDEVNVKNLTSAALKDLDEYGESHSYYNFWQSHGDEFKELVRSQASEELEKFRSNEAMWIELCDDLPDDLSDYKVMLQREYGISESTIEDEIEEWPRIV